VFFKVLLSSVGKDPIFKIGNLFIL